MPWSAVATSLACVGEWIVAKLGMACALALALWGLGSGANARGGGGYRAPIVIYSPGAPPPGPFVPKGDLTAMAIEITDAPVSATEGVLAKGDAIALHTVRAMDAVVLLEAVAGSHGVLPAGLVLAKVTTVWRPTPVVMWCDTRATHRLFSAFDHDCLSDSTGSGRLDRLWLAQSPDRFFGPERTGVVDKGLLVKPVGYRVATAEERPSVKIGYRYCDGDGVAGPPRFALVVGEPGDFWPNGLEVKCAFGVWPDATDKSRVNVAGLDLDIRPAPAGGLTYKLEGRLAAQPIAALNDAKPVVALALAPTPEQEHAVHNLAMRQPPLIPAGAPTVVSGQIGVGQVFLTVPVRHGITGALRNTVSVKGGLFPGDSLGVGQPVFGVPMSGTVGSDVIWCAPRRKPGGAHWTSVCFPTDASKQYHWVDIVSPALFPVRLFWSTATRPPTSTPTVEPGETALPPMIMTIKLASVKAAKPGAAQQNATYTLAVSIDWGEGPNELSPLRVPLGLFGAQFRLLDGELKLTPGAAPDTMTVTMTRLLGATGSLPL